ncbi:MAG: ATP-binding protein [Clostridia bacterium]|nr:ATP-binding protein [Clostridia bacterium]
MTPLVERGEYAQKLRALRDTELIKVVTGVRRCGKSTLLKMFQNELLQHGVQVSQIVSVDLDDFGNIRLRDPQSLYAHLAARVLPDMMTYIFLDEVQLCPGFEDVANSLCKRSNVDLYLTGSNAVTLSSELATRIAGRYVEIPMLPLSFREYMTGTEPAGSLTEMYSRYLETSAFPFTLRLKDKAQIDSYLASIYDAIVARDISLRHNLTNPQRMLPVLAFLMDSIGNRISVKRIADTLSSGGRQTNVRTAEKYLQAFLDSFILYRAGRYDVKGREHLRTLEKYYAVDLGLRRVIGGLQNTNAGSMLENVVYLELRRRGFQVYTGKVGSREVDFVAMKPGDLRYYQVSATVRDPAVMRRELEPLEQIRDHCPKKLLVLDEDPEMNHNGIRQLNVLKWLTDLSLVPRGISLSVIAHAANGTPV